MHGTGQLAAVCVQVELEEELGAQWQLAKRVYTPGPFKRMRDRQLNDFLWRQPRHSFGYKH
jgi:hypothetical protein